MASGRRHYCRRLAGCAALAAAVGGCAESSPVGSAATVRDSAGIRIVEYSAAAVAQLPEWQVSAEPAITIGGSADAADDPGEVVGAYFARDGAIVYADGAALELRIHAPDGALIRSQGRRGSGPGEFGNITSIWPRGDSSAVYDMAAKRLTVVPHDGSPPRIATLRHSGFLASVQGSANGTLVSRQLDLDALTGVGAATERIPEHVIAVSPDGGSTDTILVVPGPALYLPPASPGWDGPAPVGFGPESEILVTGDSIVVGTNDSYELTTYDFAGTAVRTLRVAGTGRPVEEQDVARARQAAWEEFQSRSGSMPEEIVSQYRSFLDAQRYAERLPFYRTLATDPEGNLWVEEYGRPGTAEERYTVFDRDGSPIARVTLPSGLHFLAAGGDKILGLWRDPDGLGQIRVHRLTGK